MKLVFILAGALMLVCFVEGMALVHLQRQLDGLSRSVAQLRDEASRPAPAISLTAMPASASPSQVSSERIDQLVADSLNRQRAELRERLFARQQEIQRGFQEKIVRELRLDLGEARQLADILDGAEQQRRQIFEGEKKTPEETRAQLGAVRERTLSELRNLLGEARLQRFEGLERGGPYAFLRPRAPKQ
jgi:hypothetical protein